VSSVYAAHDPSPARRVQWGAQATSAPHSSLAKPRHAPSGARRFVQCGEHVADGPQKSGPNAAQRPSFVPLPVRLVQLGTQVLPPRQIWPARTSASESISSCPSAQTTSKLPSDRRVIDDTLLTSACSVEPAPSELVPHPAPIATRTVAVAAAVEDRAMSQFPKTLEIPATY
jgi:hypothetical protein